MVMLDVVSIATGKYLDYFARLLPELERFLAPGEEIEIHLFTDRRNFSFQREDARIRVHLIPISPQIWPDVTLYRYHQIVRHRDAFSGRNLMWLDCDMALKKSVPAALFESTDIRLAYHPTFLPMSGEGYQLPGPKLARIVRQEAGLRIRGRGKMGDWELNRQSRAYLPWVERRRYFHGAVWFGPTSSILDMCELLAERIDDDSSAGFVAKWHDESHLNWWAGYFPSLFTPLPPFFSAWPKAPQYRPEEAHFVSLNKQTLDIELGLNA